MVEKMKIRCAMQSLNTRGVMCKLLKGTFVAITILTFSKVAFSQVIQEKEVKDLMEKSEILFKDMKANEIAEMLSNGFEYDFLTKVDGSTYDEKLNFQSYINYLKIFFQSDPFIEKYTIDVQKIRLLKEQATVEFTIDSLITVDGLSQKCKGSGMSKLEKHEKLLLLKSVQGSSQCTIIRK